MTKINDVVPFDAIKLLQTLVSMDSCDPPGHEVDIAKLLHAELLAHGIDAELDEFLPGRANVLGCVKGKGTKPALVLSAHLDTVPVASSLWSFPPFSGAAEDGRILGRGSSDMKSAVAAMVAAAIQIRYRPAPLQGDLILAFSAGESSNCLGAKRFVELGLRKRMGALLVGEPSSMDVIVAEKAVLWLRVGAQGRLGHVSGDPGVNAIDIMVDFLKLLKEVRLSHEAHPLLDGPTIRVGLIEGGSAVNLTPDSCFAEIDVRFAPKITSDEVLQAIRNIAPSEISIIVSDFKPSVESSPDSPFVHLCTVICEQAIGRKPTIKGVSYYSDAAVLSAGLDIPFAIVGPGDLGMSGQSNESVSISNVLAAAVVYQQIAEKWLE